MTSISWCDNILGGNSPTSAMTNNVPFKTESYGGDQAFAYTDIIKTGAGRRKQTRARRHRSNKTLKKRNKNKYSRRHRQNKKKQTRHYRRPPYFI